ncbi:MAG: TRAP transporter small permease [Deltaproteobacteria bacterium]|nr:TRAP transporter small permease [Deltaproteobacteria bacterium]
MVKWGRFFDRIIETLAFLAGVLLSFILVSVSIEVFMRYFLNRPLQWVIELTEYALLYVTFLGSAWVLKEERHISVDVIVSTMSPRTQAYLGLVGTGIGIVVCLVLIWFGFGTAWDHFVRKVYNPTILEFPKAPIIAIIPVGSIFLIIQFVRRGYGLIKRIKNRENPSSL